MDNILLHIMKTEACTEDSLTAEVEPNKEFITGQGSITIKEEPIEVNVKSEPIEDTEVSVKKEELFCHAFNQSSANVEELDKYVQTHSDEKYGCDICTFRTKHALVLMRHMKKHSQVEQYKCDKCSFTCRLECDLKLHLEAHFNYSCNQCDFKCLSYNEFAQHKESHMFKCEHCSKKYGRESLQIHLKSHKKEQENKKLCDKSESICVLCSFQSDDRTEFNNHIRSHCVNEPVSCHLCDYICLRQLDLTNHLHIVHDVQRGMYSMRKYACMYCSYRLKTYRDFCIHIEKVHKKTINKLICYICGSKCKSMYDLGVHKKKEHAHKDLFYQKCNMCCYKTSLMALLFKHKQKHYQGYYKCEVCDWKTEKYSHLREHLVTQHKVVIVRPNCGQVKEKYIKCRVCSYKGSTLIGLGVHMYQVHEKPLKCAKCSFRCKHIEILIQHIKDAHSDDPAHSIGLKEKKGRETLSERAYSNRCIYFCGLCNFTGFFHPVKTHMRVHNIENVKNNLCHICSAHLQTRRAYKRHMDMHNRLGDKLPQANKPIPCDLCHYIGKNQVDLKCHKSIHRVDNVYHCYYCAYVRTNRSVMVAHVQTTHQDKLKTEPTAPQQIKKEILTDSSS